MSPLSWPVVLGTLALASPALWAAQVSGTLSPDVALVRLGVCLVVVWAAVSAVVALSAQAVAGNELTAAADAAEQAQPATSDAAEPADVGEEAAA